MRAPGGKGEVAKWRHRERESLTRVVEAAADLHRPQLAVKAHRAGGVGGDLAGILVHTVTAAIY